MYLLDHKSRRGIKYIKKTRDVNSLAIFQNMMVTKYRNRFNISEPDTVLSNLDEIERRVYISIGSYGIFGYSDGFLLSNEKINPIEALRLKFIIRYRLKKYYKRGDL